MFICLCMLVKGVTSSSVPRNKLDNKTCIYISPCNIGWNRVLWVFTWPWNVEERSISSTNELTWYYHTQRDNCVPFELLENQIKQENRVYFYFAQPWHLPDITKWNDMTSIRFWKFKKTPCCKTVSFVPVPWAIKVLWYLRSKCRKHFLFDGAV